MKLHEVIDIAVQKSAFEATDGIIELDDIEEEKE